MDRAKFKEGVFLFNQGHFFEAHEAWEHLWLKDKKSETGKMLMGLIQYAACLLKQAEGQPKAALRLAQSALEKLEQVDEKTGSAWGLNLKIWLKQAKTYLKDQTPFPKMTLQK